MRMFLALLGAGQAVLGAVLLVMAVQDRHRPPPARRFGGPLRLAVGLWIAYIGCGLLLMLLNLPR